MSEAETQAFEQVIQQWETGGDEAAVDAAAVAALTAACTAVTEGAGAPLCGAIASAVWPYMRDGLRWVAERWADVWTALLPEWAEARGAIHWDTYPYRAVTTPWLRAWHEQAAGLTVEVNGWRRMARLEPMPAHHLAEITWSGLAHADPRRTVWGIAPSGSGYQTVTPRQQMPDENLLPWDTWPGGQWSWRGFWEIEPGSEALSLSGSGFDPYERPEEDELAGLVGLASKLLREHRYDAAWAMLAVNAAREMSLAGAHVWARVQGSRVRMTRDVRLMRRRIHVAKQLPHPAVAAGLMAVPAAGAVALQYVGSVRRWWGE